MTVLQKVGTPIISAALAIGVGSLIIWVSGYDPGAAFAALFKGSFGAPEGRSATPSCKSTPLILTGLAVAYGFRAGLFNIGAEGQLYHGRPRGDVARTAPWPAYPGS